MTKEEFQKDKMLKISAINREIAKLIKRAHRITQAKPAKKKSTVIYRAYAIAKYCFQIRGLYCQIQIIMSQPFPNFPGGSSGIVGESSPELIQINDGRIVIPENIKKVSASATLRSFSIVPAVSISELFR